MSCQLLHLLQSRNSPVRVCFNELVAGDHLRDVQPVFFLRSNRLAILQQLRCPTIIAKHFTSIYFIREVIELHDDAITEQLFDRDVLNPNAFASIGQRTRQGDFAESILTAFYSGGVSEFKHIVRFIEQYNVNCKQKRFMDDLIKFSKDEELIYCMFDYLGGTAYCSGNGLKEAVKKGYRSIVDMHLEVNGGDMSWMAFPSYVEYLVQHGWSDLLAKLVDTFPNKVHVTDDALMAAIEAQNTELFVWIYQKLIESARQRGYSSYNPIEYSVQRELAKKGTPGMIMAYLVRYDSSLRLHNTRWEFIDLMLVCNEAHAAEVLKILAAEHRTSRVTYLLRRDREYWLAQIQNRTRNWELYKTFQQCTSENT